MEDIGKFVPVEQRGYQDYSPERADAQTVNYHKKLQSVANDETLTEDQKKAEIESLALTLGYILLTEYNRKQTRS